MHTPIKWFHFATTLHSITQNATHVYDYRTIDARYIA